jgi:hypothetical protein
MGLAMHPSARTLPILLLSLALVLPLAARADFTEHEDQPFLTPGNAEENTLTTALPVPEGGAPFLSAFPDGVKLVRGNLDASDRDAYAVQMSSGQLLLAALFDKSGGAFLDTALGVFNGTTPPAAALDDDGARGFLSRLHFTVTSTGLKRVAVTGFGDTSFNGTHQEGRGGLRPYYLLLAAAVNPPALRESDLEPGPQGSNNAIANADLLPENGGVVGASLVPNDVDFYGMELEAGDRLFVALFDMKSGVFEPAQGSFADPVLALFGPQGNLVAGGVDDDSHEGFAPSLTYLVPGGAGGLYRFAVTGFSEFVGGSERPFDYLLAAARERACPNVVPLISNLTTSSGRPNGIAALQGGQHYYQDRNGIQRHVLVDVPEDLECGQWIKTANDDKNVTAFPHLTFTLAQDASIFIGYDTRATGEPAWLASGFTPLPGPVLLDIRDSDETQEFRLLRRDFKAGTVQLGGNFAPGAGSNYVVAAVPVDTADAQHAFEVPPAIQTGTAFVTIAGVTVTIATSFGQSPAAVAAALAAAVNANPTLQGLRVFAIGSGPFFVATAPIQDFSYVDEIPLASPWALAALALMLVMGARLYLRSVAR